jgi:vacuolar-type H+-ATPase subunit E/Vma4
MIELKRRIINKDKDLLQEYFNKCKDRIRTTGEDADTLATLIFIEQVQDYILEEAD